MASPLTSGVEALPLGAAPAEDADCVGTAPAVDAAGAGTVPAPSRAWTLPLQEAVRALEAEGLQGVPVAQLGEDLRCLRRIGDRLEAEFARRLAGFERRGGPAAAGAASAIAWLTRQCRLSAPEANSRLQLARRFEELPAVTAAVRKGEIGFEHATVLARCASEVGAATVAPSPALQAEASRLVERDLLDSARQVDPGRLREQARHHRHQVDPEGAQDAFARARARRRLSLGELPDGMLTLEGRLDPEGGALLRTALEQLTPPPRPGDRRSPAQRRADALTELARRGLDGRPGARAAGRRPHLVVTVPVATLEGRRGAPGAELGSGAVVPAAVAQRLACDAVLTEVGVDQRGQPVAVARARRTVPPSTWRALVVRDGGCVLCRTCPPSWCDAHHWKEPWSRRRRSRLEDLCLLCRRCHVDLHAQGLRLQREPGGGWRAVRGARGVRPP